MRDGASGKFDASKKFDSKTGFNNKGKRKINKLKYITNL
jgi:hypothetical protein